MRLSTILARLDNYDGPFMERMLAIIVFSAKQELTNDKHHCLNFRVQFVSSPACALTVNQSQGMALSKEFGPFGTEIYVAGFFEGFYYRFNV